MVERTFTTELSLRVYDDKDGEFIQVSPDRDGLDLVRIFCNENKAEFVMLPEMARLVGKALIRVADDIESTQKK